MFLGVFCQARAQDANPNITFKSSKADIDLSNQQMADVIVKIQNRGSSPITGYFDVELSPDIRLLSKNHVRISLMPGDSLFVSAQVFTGKYAAADRPYPIIMRIVSDNNVLAETRCTLHIAVKKSMTLTPLVSSVLLNPQLISIKIPVSVSNAGNTTQKVSIIVKYPYLIEGADKSFTVQLSLPPSADTVIYFERPVNHKMQTTDGFDINILGLYASGEIFGMSYARVQIAKSDRRFYSDNSDEFSNNSISLVSQNMFAPNQSYQVNGRGMVDMPGGKLGFGVDMTAWRSSYSPTMFRNTFLSYETHNMGLTVGDINRNFDINLYGKGAAFSFKDTARRNVYEAGYINANPNLFTETAAGYPSLGTVGWFSNAHKSKHWELISYVLQQKSPMLNVNNLLLSNQLNWFSSPKLYISGILSAGSTMELSSNNRKYSWATGLNATGKLNDNWDYASSNYLSSAFYPGIRSGATTFSEKITYTTPQKSIWANIDYYKYAPGSFADAFQLPEYGNFRAELGVSKRHKGFSFSVIPQYSKETNNSYFIPVPGSTELGQPNPVSYLRSIGINSSATYSMSIFRRFSITVKGGMYNSSFDKQYNFHYNINSTYTDRFFNVNASFQSGNFYIGEVLNSLLKPGIKNRLIMVNPNLHMDFFRKKGQVEAGASYLNNSFNGTSILFMGRVAYDVLSKTNLYIAVNHNRYQYTYGVYQSSIFEAGITQKLSSLKVTDNKNTMDFLVFKDNNHNGVYDKGDSVSANNLVYINDIAFVTRADGTIRYKNVPFGNYRIVIENNNGWYAPEQYIVFKKKLDLQIPLDRIGTVKGSIGISVKKFSYDIRPEKGGITIKATDENNKVYTTKTNPDGRYIFYIPEGNYTISCDQQSIPSEVECTNNDRPVRVKFNSVNVIDFDLSIKNKKLEIKKYTSPSLREKRK
ncbi:MAG: hypothetical protein ACXVJD_00615 [Mucilaginibacter sp.]